MKIKLTTISSEEAGEILGEFCIELEKALNGYCGAKEYGPLNMFVIGIIAVDDDVQENLKFGRTSNASGTTTHPFTREKQKYFSIAVYYSPTKIVELRRQQLKVALCGAIMEELTTTSVKVPKGFELDELVGDIRIAMEIYKVAD
jgi:hypothetical protein